MESMISAIVSVKELLGTIENKIGFFRNHQNEVREEYKLPKDRIFNIPGYQREIRWSTNNIQVLVDDVIKESKFLGIVLASSSDNKVFDIIDGQQRLTVILMLISAMNRKSDYDHIKQLSSRMSHLRILKKQLKRTFIRKMK